MSEPSETSEQSAKITTAEKNKAAKLKDPRKVETKERKARQQSKAEAVRVEKEVKSEITDHIDFRYFIGGVGLVAALGGSYSYKRDKREIREENEIVNNVKKTNDDKINKSTSQGKEKKCLIENL